MRKEDFLVNEQIKDSDNAEINPSDVLKPNVTINQIVPFLPSRLKMLFEQMSSDREKELALISVLGVLSGMLPNYTATYDGKLIESILYVFIYGGYGSGKGGLSNASVLGNLVDTNLKNIYESALIQYQNDIKIYNKEMAIWKKSEGLEIPREEPSKPYPNQLFLPANITKAGLLELLNGTKGRGVLFTTEGDELVNAIKMEHGSFGDLLRMNFHHEPFRVFRKGDGEPITIDSPSFSVVLSGTPDQMRLLINSPENGLYSRFMYYKLPRDPSFGDVFSDKKTLINELYKEGSVFFNDMYFNHLNNPTTFALNSVHSKKFTDYMNYIKKKLIDGIDLTMEGTANRYGLIAFRLMMILTAIRAYETNSSFKQLTCSEEDFNNAFNIMDLYGQYALFAYESITSFSNDERKIQKLAKDHSYREISRIVYGDIKHYNSVRRLIEKNQWR